MSNLDIEVEYYSLLRNPLRQLVSQICWQIEICSKKHNIYQFLKSQPVDSIHRIMQALFCDLNDISSINNYISRNPGYLSNHQSRYLMAEYGINLNYQSISKSDCLEFLKKFRYQCFDMYSSIKFLGSDQNINNALKNFGVTDLTKLRNVDKNKSELYINPEFFSRHDFVKGLINYNLLNCILYLSHLESISENKCKIINMDSIDTIYESIFEYIFPSFSYEFNSYNPKKQLDIQISIAKYLKRKDENLKIDYYANTDMIVSDLLNSTSWKITKPLRYIFGKYKKSTKLAKNFLIKVKAFIKKLL